MEQLKKTRNGIYYLDEYCPKWKFRYATDDEISQTHAMWEYKNGDNGAVEEYTTILLEAITILTKHRFPKRVGLVAVPPSKSDSRSSIRESISMIVDMSDFSDEEFYGFDADLDESINYCVSELADSGIILYDCGNLLRRKYDISTAHYGHRASYAEQYHSIECTEDNLEKFGMLFILIDDITTTGKSMDVCRQIMVDHGAESEHILRLALARTK